MFTINNPRDPAHAYLVEFWPDLQYAIWQLERGENGTPHYQGYVAFKGKKRLNWLKNNCSKEAHWEPRKGSHDQAKAYCTKAETRVEGPFDAGEELEEFGQQGKRNDLQTLKRKLDEGASELAIAESDETFAVWAKYYKVVGRYRMLKCMNERKWHTYCQVYWGPPGVGKSRRALEEAGPGAYWLPRPEGANTVWWDGYEGQEVVVIDEFYGWIMRDKMQRLCDRYPLLVQTKGGTTPFLAKKIIITSNEHPLTWWPKVGLGAMTRRLEGECGKIIHMTDPGHEDVLSPLPGPPPSPVPPRTDHMNEPWPDFAIPSWSPYARNWEAPAGAYHTVRSAQASSTRTISHAERN